MSLDSPRSLDFLPTIVLDQVFFCLDAETDSEPTPKRSAARAALRKDLLALSGTCRLMRECSLRFMYGSITIYNRHLEFIEWIASQERIWSMVRYLSLGPFQKKSTPTIHSIVTQLIPNLVSLTTFRYSNPGGQGRGPLLPSILAAVALLPSVKNLHLTEVDAPVLPLILPNFRTLDQLYLSFGRRISTSIDCLSLGRVLQQFSSSLSVLSLNSGYVMLEKVDGDGLGITSFPNLVTLKLKSTYLHSAFLPHLLLGSPNLLHLDLHASFSHHFLDIPEGQTPSLRHLTLASGIAHPSLVNLIRGKPDLRTLIFTLPISSDLELALASTSEVLETLSLTRPISFDALETVDKKFGGSLTTLSFTGIPLGPTLTEKPRGETFSSPILPNLITLNFHINRPPELQDIKFRHWDEISATDDQRREIFLKVRPRLLQAALSFVLPLVLAIFGAAPSLRIATVSMGEFVWEWEAGAREDGRRESRALRSELRFHKLAVEVCERTVEEWEHQLA